MLILRFAAAIALFATFLAPFLPTRRAILWAIPLGGAMALAIGAFRQWAESRRNIRLVSAAAGLVEPAEGRLVAVCGTVETDGEPLRSPLFDEPAAAYQYVVQHSETRPTSRPGRTSTREVRDYAGYGAVPMSIRGAYFTARLGEFPMLHEFPKRDNTGSSLMEMAGEASARAAAGTETRGEIIGGVLQSGERREAARLDHVRGHVRSARFDETPPSEMLEYVEWWRKEWDGAAPVARNHRRVADFEPRDFWEQRVAPGQPACALGVWSQERKALVHAPGRELQLYPGTVEDVKQVFARHAGAGLFVSLLLGAGSILFALYLIR